MSVWLVLPSKRPAEEAEKCLSLWRKQGYKIAVQRDSSEADPISLGGGNVAIMEQKVWANGDWFFFREYKGYAEAVNFIVSHVLAFNPDCDWIVAAGDDTEPDMNHTADEIAAQCSRHFADIAEAECYEADYACVVDKNTFGVMQPTGDRWGEGLYPNAHKYQETPGDPNRCSICHTRSGGPNHCVGANIDRVASSAWMGREWCLRANQGKGTQWPYFFHSYADETLQCVAEKLGVFWQRRDLIHLHRHWARPKEGQRIGQVTDMPEFAKRANSEEEETRSKAEFERLRAGGFAECLPL